MKGNETYAYFSVSGFDCSTEAITSRLGVNPTRYWVKGDVDPQTHRERKYSRWSLYSRLAKTEDLEAHVRDVLQQMDEHADAFRAVSLEFEGLLQLVGYFHQDYPGFSLDAGQTERIGFYRLCLDCDFYYLYSNAREDSD